MGSEELLLIVGVVVVLLVLVIMLTGKHSRKNYLNAGDRILLDRKNMRRTNYNGRALPPQALPELGPSEFMNARYKVVVDDAVGDNVEPLSDLCIAGFKNPNFEHGLENNLPKISKVNRISQKSTPYIANDDKQFHHVAAEMMTPDFRVKMSGKAAHFLPHTGGKSRLNFTSYENHRDEAPFRQ
jgi:hypothetical protein